MKLPVDFTPHGYQQQGIDWLTKEPGGKALFLDMGLGKTATVLGAFKKLKDAGKVHTMMIVAPLRVAQATWPNEIHKWIDFYSFTFTIIHGPLKAEALKKDVDIYLINYEGLPWLYSQRWKATDVIVFDELTRMKSWSSLRVKVIRHYLPLYRYRWGLTGTPVPNGLIDVFSQVYMLDLGLRFGTRITRFRDKYFAQPTKYTWTRALLPGAADSICDALTSLAYRVEGNDWLDLPEEIHNPILLEFPKELQAKYAFLKKEFILHLEGQVITAASASVLSTKLRQLLSGNMYNEAREIVPIHEHKLKALKDFLEDNEGRPVLVAYKFRHELEMFKRHFPKATFVEGKTTGPELQQIIKDWNDGEIPILFGHPASVGHGLNLQGGSNTVLFYSLDFNAENYLQFIKRVSRQGQPMPTVIIHYLLFEGTIDEYVLEVLQGKLSVQSSLLDYLAD